MKTLSLILFLLNLFCIKAGYSQNDSLNTGIVYGKEFAFAVTSPEGWKLDNKSGVSQGLHAVFYPEGDNWENAIAVMYCNSALKKEGSETIEKIIEYDVNNFKNNNNSIIKDEDEIYTRDKKKAVIKFFFDSVNKNYEYVAYIDEKPAVMLLVLSSRNKDKFNESKNAFTELVKSYILVSDEVIIEEK